VATGNMAAAKSGLRLRSMALTENAPWSARKKGACYWFGNDRVASAVHPRRHRPGGIRSDEVVADWGLVVGHKVPARTAQRVKTGIGPATGPALMPPQTRARLLMYRTTIRCAEASLLARSYRTVAVTHTGTSSGTAARHHRVLSFVFWPTDFHAGHIVATLVKRPSDHFSLFLCRRPCRSEAARGGAPSRSSERVRSWTCGEWCLWRSIRRSSRI
jgi:hypothetical protein